MEAAFNDLQILCTFDHCRVPPPSNHTSVDLFASLIASPWSTTLKWSKLVASLQSYFTSPSDIDVDQIRSGWNGLQLIVCCFKRLEAAIDAAELVEIESWITSLLRAAIQQR